MTTLIRVAEAAAAQAANTKFDLGDHDKTNYWRRLRAVAVTGSSAVNNSGLGVFIGKTQIGEEIRNFASGATTIPKAEEYVPIAGRIPPNTELSVKTLTASTTTANTIWLMVEP